MVQVFVAQPFWIENELKIRYLRCWHLLQGKSACLCFQLAAMHHTFLERGHRHLGGNRQGVLPFVQQPGLLPTNEHATFWAIEPVRAGMIDLISTVHWLGVGIVADKPPQGWQSLGSSLDLDDPLKQTTHLISILDDPMELEIILPGVASDGFTVCMSCVLSEII